MSTTFQKILDRAKARYGLLPGIEDAQLLDTSFLDRANEILAELSEGTQAWRQDVTLDLPTTNPVALPSNVYQVIDGSVRLDLDGTGQFLTEVVLDDEAALRSMYGPIETIPAAVPTRYFLARGNAAGAMLNLFLTPPSSVAVSGGLKLSAAVYAPTITTWTDTVALQQGEERFLIPGLCLALAETEHSRGRGDAPITLWDRRWQEAKAQFAIAARENVQGSRPRIHYEPDIYDW